MKSGKLTSQPRTVAKPSSIAAQAHKEVGRVLALILVPNVAFLLGVGLLAPTAAVSAIAAGATPSVQSAGPIPAELVGFSSATPTLGVGLVATRIVGFVSSPITVTVGRAVTNDVVVLPRASRQVQVQVRRSGTRTFVKTPMSGPSSKAGAFRAIYRPTAGVWQYRLVVLASATARSAISPIRTVTAKPPAVTPPKDTTAPGPVTTLSATAVSTTSIKLDWANPAATDFTGVTIRRAAGPTAPRTTTDGSSVPVTASANVNSYTDTGLNAGTQYSYAVFAHDRVPNYATAANVSRTTTTSTTAALVVNSTRATVGLDIFFDPSSTNGATGATLTETLDYGDGTPAEAYTGDPAGWFSLHGYATAGAKTATLTVTDSAKNTVNKVVTIHAYDPPTAAIPATGQAQVGVPFTFPITATTPVGTAFQSWNLYGDWLAGGYGAGPPATLTHTFMEAGVHTFTLTVADDAQGTAISSEMVVTVQ